MALSAGQIKDRGIKGLTFQDKRIVLEGASHIEPQGSVTLFEDFLVDVLTDSPYVTVTQSGTEIGVAAISATAGAPGSTAHGGWVAGATDDVDAEIDEVAFGGLGTGAGTPWMRANRAGNGVLIAELGMVIPVALTARQYFFGLTDDALEETGTNGPLNIQTAYTLVDVAADAAGFIYSSLATNPTIWKVASTLSTVGSTVDATKEGVTGVVDEYTVLRVEVDAAGNAYFYNSISGSATTKGRNANLSFVSANALAVTPTVGLLPMFTAAATATTSVEWELDYCFASAPR
jgi:hypothetical protein